MTKIPTKDWRNLPIEDWNTNSFHAFLIEETARKFNAEYVPGGKGSKSQRWIAEKGVLKRDIDKRGAEVVRKFIEICWAEYFTPDPKKYPYPTYFFMISYMDRYWTQAIDEVAKERERAEIAERSDSTKIDEGWF